ncbi:hypothetical protein GLF_0967 [Gluconobacter frateurii NBRC 101659]|nr:hypothetical protein GLF_0967 [Gluconobacter frateurii NBRC 101659]
MTLTPAEAERLLRSRYGEPAKVPTGYVIGFQNPVGRVLAIHRTNKTTCVWFQPPAPPPMVGVALLSEPKNGNSNINGPLAPLKRPDTQRAEIDSPTALQRFLEWYDGTRAKESNTPDPINGVDAINTFPTLLSKEAKGDLAKDEKADARYLGGKEKSILDIKDSVGKTVFASNGQMVPTTVKNKELHMSDAELDKLIRNLFNIQKNRCAITGLPFQFPGSQMDDNMLPSLDRIDSDGHYSRGNLQLVCRFINFWKQASNDGEFRRLIAIIRGSQTNDR